MADCIVKDDGRVVLTLGLGPGPSHESATPIERHAILSDDGRYRYLLTRRWANGPTMGWVMLNPSTADHTVDDPTIRRCMDFARREGCGGIAVVNLFALRATNPMALYDVAIPDRIGPENVQTIGRWAWTVDRVVVGWGAHPLARDYRRTLVDIEGAPYLKPLCLGTNADGSPKHPLYLRADAPLLPWGGYRG